MSVDVLDAVLWVVVIAAVLTAPTFLLRWMSGWTALEQSYESPTRARSISLGSFRWVRSRFGRIRVGLRVELYEDGLWMRMHFPANRITKPVLLPWNAIPLTPLPTLFLGSRVELAVNGFPKVIRFIGHPSCALLERYQRNGGVDEPDNALTAKREIRTTEHRR